IDVSFDWQKRSVRGNVTITFRPFQNGLHEVEFDAGDMTIHSVKLASGAPLNFRYEHKEELYVVLDREYPAGADISIAIDYTATPSKGLTFVTPSEADPGQPYQIWTEGQPENNHYWFPCYDYPNDLATSELITTVDSRFQVLSNGELTEMKSEAGD